MKFPTQLNPIPLVFVLIFLFLTGSCKLSAAPRDSTRYLGGAASITNNGVSLLPTFSLNKPAALIVLNMGKRFSFDPEFRFSLEDGKPWSFIFWGRYKLVQHNKFRITVGAHPGYLFRSIAAGTQAASPMIATERYLAGELAPSYFVTKNTSLGFYYLRSKGFAESSVKHTHFLTFNANFNKIGLYKSYYLKFNPQVYYLKMDDRHGYYVTAMATVAKTHFPISVQALVNKTITSQIASADFIWNVSVMYAFEKQYRSL